MVVIISPHSIVLVILLTNMFYSLSLRREADKITCFGVQSTSSFACGGNGVCVNFDECQCVFPYMKPDCYVPVSTDHSLRSIIHYRMRSDAISTASSPHSTNNTTTDDNEGDSDDSNSEFPTTEVVIAVSVVFSFIICVPISCCCCAFMLLVAIFLVSLAILRATSLLCNCVRGSAKVHSLTTSTNDRSVTFNIPEGTAVQIKRTSSSNGINSASSGSDDGSNQSARKTETSSSLSNKTSKNQDISKDRVPATTLVIHKSIESETGDEEERDGEIINQAHPLELQTKEQEQGETTAREITNDFTYLENKHNFEDVMNNFNNNSFSPNSPNSPSASSTTVPEKTSTSNNIEDSENSDKKMKKPNITIKITSNNNSNKDNGKNMISRQPVEPIILPCENKGSNITTTANPSSCPQPPPIDDMDMRIRKMMGIEECLKAPNTPKFFANVTREKKSMENMKADSMKTNTKIRKRMYDLDNDDVTITGHDLLFSRSPEDEGDGDHDAGLGAVYNLDLENRSFRQRRHTFSPPTIGGCKINGLKKRRSYPMEMEDEDLVSLTKTKKKMGNGNKNEKVAHLKV